MWDLKIEERMPEILCHTPPDIIYIYFLSNIMERHEQNEKFSQSLTVNQS